MPVSIIFSNLTTVIRFVCKTRDTIIVCTCIVALPRETLGGIIRQGGRSLRIVAAYPGLRSNGSDAVDPVHTGGLTEWWWHDIMFRVAW